MVEQDSRHVMILGVGNLLLTDEGVGIQVAQFLTQNYTISGNVSIEDGGVLGVNLLGVLSEADYLIVVDAVRKGGEPGSLYRLEGVEVPKRIYAKNSLHQVDLLEALTLCQALDRVPETVILGIEPLDIQTVGVELTPPVQDKFQDLVSLVLKELDSVGVRYLQKENDTSCA